MEQSSIPHDRQVPTPQGNLFARIWHADPVPNLSAQPAPIFLFHDSLGCVELWRDFPNHLRSATCRTIIAYDRLGFGQSDPHPDAQPLDFIEREAQIYFSAVREYLGIQDFILLGHSVGGGMAVHCAAAFPNHCRALVTESAQSFIEDRTAQGVREAKEEFRKAGQFDRLKKYHGEKAQWVLDAWTETWTSPAFQSWNLDLVLPQVMCPTLAIHGQDDEYGSPAHAQRIARLVSGPSQVEILPGVRHVPHRERASALLDLVRKFLDKPF